MEAQDTATLKIVLMLDLIARDGLATAGTGLPIAEAGPQPRALALRQATIGQPLRDLTSPPVCIHALGAGIPTETPIKVKLEGA